MRTQKCLLLALTLIRKENGKLITQVDDARSVTSINEYRMTPVVCMRNYRYIAGVRSLAI